MRRIAGKLLWGRGGYTAVEGEGSMRDARGRGMTSSRQPSGVDACVCDGAPSSATVPSPVTLEEAPSRVPSRVGSGSARRRGPSPGPRRPSVGQHKLVRSRSNREIAHAAKVKDEGQISKLLRRLEDHGLLENTGGASPAGGNAWRLTAGDRELLTSVVAEQMRPSMDPSLGAVKNNETLRKGR